MLPGDNNDVRCVYLQGSKEPIAQRPKNHKGHFMHPDLLGGQIDTLQEPGAAIVVCITQSPQEIVARISSDLRLAL